MSERTPDSLQMVRKVQAARISDFDEQLWPINCAVLILAGFTAGIVYALSDFSDPRLLYNGWVRLVGVGILVSALFLAVWYLQGKMLRRVQLCILISLLAHLWLAVYLHEKYMAVLAMREAEARQVTDPDVATVLQDYHWEQIEQPEQKSSIEQPVRIETPEPTQPEVVERQQVEHEVPREERPPTEPEPPQQQQPSPADLQRADLSAPRRAEVAAGGQISRQPWQHRPQPNEPIPQPEVQPAGEEATTPIRAQVTSVERQEADRPSQQRRTFEEPASERQPERVELARRATESEPLPDVPTTPTPTRQLAQAAEVPRTEASVPEPVAAIEQPRPVELQPTVAENVRRQPEVPRAALQAPEPLPTPTTSPQVARNVAPQRRAEQSPELARAVQPPPSRQSRPMELPTAMAEAIPQAGAAAPQAQTPLAAAESQVGRQAAQVSPTRVATPQAELPAAPASQAVVRAQPRRAAEPSSAAATESPAEPPRIARQATAAESLVPTAVVPAAAGPAAPAASAEPSLAAAQPSSADVARTATAPAQTAPAADSPGRSIPAMTEVAQLPAVAARRSEPSQQQPSGAEPSPARPATLARSATGGIAMPSTALAAQPDSAAAPSPAGASPASRLEAASAAAAVSRSASQAPTGPATAAAGRVELALGATQVPARVGQPRGSARDEPSVAANAPSPRLARAQTGAAIGAAPSAETAPSASVAAAGESGGPSVPTVSREATLASRSGRAVLPSTQPAIGSGAPGASGAAGQVGAADLARVTRQESTSPSTVSGGGAAMPARTQVGPQFPVETQVEAPQMAATAPGGGSQPGTPLEAAVRGEDRQVAGLPGSRQAAASAGTLAAMRPDGAPLPEAVARRAEAAQARDGAAGLEPNIAATLARTPGGVDLPAVAAPIEQSPGAGAGGVTVAEGAAASSLEVASVAGVARAAAQVPTGSATAATGTAEFAVGSAPVALAAGRTRAADQGVPALAMNVPTPIGRSAAMPAATAAAIEASAEQAGVTGQAAGESPSGVEAGAAAALAARGAASPLPTTAAPEAGGADQGTADAPAVAAAQLARAGQAEMNLDAATGGETAGSARRMTRTPTADALAATPDLAAAAPTAGQPTTADEGSLQAAAMGQQRQRAGLPGDLNQRVAVDSAAVAGPTATTPGSTAGPRRAPQGIDRTPSLAAEMGGALARRSDALGLPRGLAEAIDQEPRAAMAAELGATTELALGAGVGELARREGGLPVQIAALSGPGGLSYDPSPEVGIPSRRARPESEVVHTISRRFIVERSGGELAVEGVVREPTAAFRQRDPGLRAQAAEEMGGSAGTERAVEMGLDFFARTQFPDGRWSLHRLPPGVEMKDPGLGQMESDTAATGLALLAYYGAGYTHLEDKHRAVVRRGIDWLVANQKPNGDLFSGGTRYAWFYSHGIATIALCEAYGMTQDPELRDPARKAIEFALSTQHAERGGWRYDVNPATGRATETDTSVTGWLLMALKSAQMAGIDVPQEAFDKIEGWLELAQAPGQDGRYVYNPLAADTPQQREGRHPSLAMTAEAMLMQMYLGKGRDDARLRAGADYLKENVPQVGTAARPLRDCYYWYYATQAMFQMRDDHWQQWNDAMRPLLESSQVQTGEAAGSWHPAQPVRDRWGREGGRHYVTAMQLLMLEVYYRHLPLFEELAR